MDRLTGNPITEHVAGDREIRDRLAEYEDTGLAPEQISQAIDRAEKAEADCADMIKALQAQLVVITEEIDGLKKCEEINRGLYISLRERLGTYEDTRLLPDEIRSLAMRVRNLTQGIERIYDYAMDYQDLNTELAEVSKMAYELLNTK